MKRLWTTADGTKIPIKELSDQHLKNIAAMLLRNAKQWISRSTMDGLTMVSSLRGEMAIYYAEQELDAILGADPQDVVEQEYPEIFAELERRGLND